MSYLSTADSFSKGIITQLQPRMLFAIVLPLVIAMVSILFLLIFAWNPLDEWFFSSAADWGWFQKAQSFGWGFSTMSDWLAGLLSFISLSAIGVIIGLAAAAIMVTPLAVKFISERYFPNLEKKGQHVNSVSTFNAIKVSCIFIVGWLLTLPLWFIPFMSIILSLFWGAYAFSHMSQVDAIVEHATAEERKYILSTHKKGFWFIGFVCAALSLIPFMGLVMPVFSIIVCTHYGLKALERYRQQKNTLEMHG
ncbi:EI24 domain-containing protein [Pelistega suis]|uniref:EI24 domain-containing protein n=1 Tax=Pelistega suis TaxID=1631957 RepID=UPI00211CA5D5|nr:EI24 domain-containing protein [Pelistega suis]MCQ9329213.1 EI24 domain-containing protein [Pelistega suis]